MVENTLSIPRPRIGRGRWRRIKLLLREFFDGPVPPQEYWCAVDLANFKGFRVRDAQKYIGGPVREQLSAKERRGRRRDLARCSCGRTFKMVQHDGCPACGELYIPF